jgi:molybdopterin synthase catalytic subunit
MTAKNNKKTSPSIDAWLREAKADPAAAKVGMFLVHNGIVRQTPKAQVRDGLNDGSLVRGLEFSYDAAKVDEVIAETRRMEGIFYLKVWLNEGKLEIGDDIMYVIIGGDIRPRVIEALQFLVGKIKTDCVTEIEDIAPNLAGDSIAEQPRD